MGKWLAVFGPAYTVWLHPCLRRRRQFINGDKRVPTEYQKLLERVHELDDLNKAASLMAWDREVNMPRGV